MLHALPLVLLAAFAAAPDVEVSMLDGSAVRGRLEGLSATTVSLQSDSGPRQLNAADLLEIRFPQPQAQPAGKAEPKVSVLTLADGSVFNCSSLSVAGQDVTVETPSLGTAKARLTSLASIRFGKIDADSASVWSELQGRESKRDQLVLRRDKTLDHFDGVVGSIDADEVHFASDGEEIRAKREKIFGVIYARRAPETARAQCEATLADGSVTRVRKVSFENGQFTLELLMGASVSLSGEKLKSLDFSLGKVRYLSQLEPRDVKYTPFFDHTWEYERDKNKEGKPLQLGDRKYDRGLWIHSKTQLRYRIGGEFRRFQTVVGIDNLVARNGRGDVHVVISGDGRPLWQADVRGTDDPKPIDLDVSSIRDLEILVDFGGDLDISDHLDLADARLIK